MSINELSAKAKELKELKALAAQIADEISTIEDLIKQTMTAEGKEEIVTDMFTLRYTTVKSRRFDSTAFKKTHGDLYDQYTKETTTKRFSVA